MLIDLDLDDTPLDLAAMATLLSASGDPLGVSRSPSAIIAAWSDLATRMGAADEPTFAAWADTARELGREEPLEISDRVQHLIARVSRHRALDV